MGCNMEFWLNFAKGPLFVASFSLMLLGLGRLIFLRFYLKFLIWREQKGAKPKAPFSVRTLLKSLTRKKGLPPIKPVLGAVSFVFHLTLMATPLFLLEHAILWRHGLGFAWPTFGREVSDFLTLATILTGVALMGLRAMDPEAQHRRSFKDYLLLAALLIPFVSGYITMHPQYLFTRVETMNLIHVLSGELIFVLIPFTSLSHIVLVFFDWTVGDFYLKPATYKAVEKLAREGVNSDVRDIIR